jgi:[protein-PII] uridylyltransferase
VKALALVAVGGYGRGELHPASDIDLLVLLAADREPLRQPGNFLTLLWDLGLQIGHSVRSVDECAELARDVTVLTNLSRRVCCSAMRLLIDVEAKLASMPGICGRRRPFFRAKLEEQEAVTPSSRIRSTALNRTSRASPGGLRDLQLIGWLARRHFGWRTVAELRATGFLTKRRPTPSSTARSSCGACATPCT